MFYRFTTVLLMLTTVQLRVAQLFLQSDVTVKTDIVFLGPLYKICQKKFSLSSLIAKIGVYPILNILDTT